MIRIAIASAFIGWLAGALYQESSADKQDDARRAAASALEKSVSQGGVVLSGRVKLKPPEAEGMTFEISDPNAGPAVEGDFAARVAKDGAGSVVLEKKGFRYELFHRGDRSAHRLSWTCEGVPIPGAVGGDLHRLLRWDRVLKQVEKSKKAEPRPDEAVDGISCRVVSCDLAPDYLEDPAKGKPGSPPPLEVSSIRATMHIDKASGLIKRMSFDVARKMNLAFGGGDEDILVHSAYVFTVGAYESALKVEIPADVEKLLR